MKNISGSYLVQKKKVVVAFGDIRGFGRWSARKLNDLDEFAKFTKSIYRIFEDYHRRKKYFLKVIGDGFMLVREMQDTELACVELHETITDCMELNTRISEEIRKCAFPRPDGFRTRIVCGPAYRIKYGTHHDYLGYVINFCSRLLQVYPDHRLIAHQSCIEMVSHNCRSLDFSVSKIKTPKQTLDGIDREDMEGLFLIRKKTHRKKKR